jgi:hypothetical protein
MTKIYLMCILGGILTLFSCATTECFTKKEDIEFSISPIDTVLNDNNELVIDVSIINLSSKKIALNKGSEMRSYSCPSTFWYLDIEAPHPYYLYQNELIHVRPVEKNWYIFVPEKSTYKKRMKISLNDFEKIPSTPNNPPSGIYHFTLLYIDQSKLYETAVCDTLKSNKISVRIR